MDYNNVKQLKPVKNKSKAIYNFQTNNEHQPNKCYIAKNYPNETSIV